MKFYRFYPSHLFQCARHFPMTMRSISQLHDSKQTKAYSFINRHARAHPRESNAEFRCRERDRRRPRMHTCVLTRIRYRWFIRHYRVCDRRAQDTSTNNTHSRIKHLCKKSSVRHYNNHFKQTHDQKTVGVKFAKSNWRSEMIVGIREYKEKNEIKGRKTSTDNTSLYRHSYDLRDH